MTYHLPAGRVVESFDQLDDSTLTTPAATDESNHLSRTDLDVESLQYLHVGPSWVREVDVSQFHGSIDSRLTVEKYTI